MKRSSVFAAEEAARLAPRKDDNRKYKRYFSLNQSFEKIIKPSPLLDL